MATTVVMKINSRNVIGIKETLAEYCQKYGDVVFIEIREEKTEQLSMLQNRSEK